MHCFLEGIILKSCLCVQPGDVGWELPLAQEVYWETKASFHELAFGPCRDFPDKSLVMLHFWIQTRKSFKGVQSFACFVLSFRAKERRWSFSNLEQFWYPMGLPYHFRDFLQAWVILYLLPLPGNTSRTCRARLNQQGKYRTFSRLCNQIFWARKKETKPKPYVMTVVGYSCVFSTTELYQIIRSPLQTYFV